MFEKGEAGPVDYEGWKQLTPSPELIFPWMNEVDVGMEAHHSGYKRKSHQKLLSQTETDPSLPGT